MIRIIIEIDNGQVTVNQNEIITDLKPVRLGSEKHNTVQHSSIKQNRICAKCGSKFIPKGPRQQLCSGACGLKVKSPKEKLRAKIKNQKPGLTTEQVNSEIEKYLNEYEQKLQSGEIN